MPARLRVRRRSLNAPQAGAAACQAAFGAAGFSSPTSRLRLRGVRATRGARSEETTCARHRRHVMVSRASFAFPRGHASRARAWRERGSQPSPQGAHINLASQRSQGRYSVVVRDLYRLDSTWLRNHFPKPYLERPTSLPSAIRCAHVPIRDAIRAGHPSPCTTFTRAPRAYNCTAGGDMDQPNRAPKSPLHSVRVFRSCHGSCAPS